MPLECTIHWVLRSSGEGFVTVFCVGAVGVQVMVTAVVNVGRMRGWNITGLNAQSQIICGARLEENALISTLSVCLHNIATLFWLQQLRQVFSLVNQVEHYYGIFGACHCAIKATR